MRNLVIAALVMLYPTVANQWYTCHPRECHRGDSCEYFHTDSMEYIADDYVCRS